MPKSNFVRHSSGHILNVDAIRWLWPLSDGRYAVVMQDETEKTIDLDPRPARELLTHLGVR